MTNHHPSYRIPKGNIPWNKGKKTGLAPWRGKKRPNLFSEETRRRIGAFHTGNQYRLGIPQSALAREKISRAQQERNRNGKPVNQYGAYKGLEGRKRTNERNDPAYLAWSSAVRKRDQGVCRLMNDNCSGYKVVHHILPWRDYPEERYNINNGITLCQYHHPRKKDDERRLIPTLQELVGSKNTY